MLMLTVMLDIQHLDIYITRLTLSARLQYNVHIQSRTKVVSSCPTLENRNHIFNIQVLDCVVICGFNCQSMVYVQKLVLD